MIFNNEEIIEIENLYGGTGTTKIYKHITENKIERMKMFANVTLEAGASIGYHQHTDDSEIYHIISGSGLFTDADESEKPVTPGDCCVIEKGQSHGIENTGDGVLEFIAVVF